MSAPASKWISRSPRHGIGFLIQAHGLLETEECIGSTGDLAPSDWPIKFWSLKYLKSTQRPGSCNMISKISMLIAFWVASHEGNDSNHAVLKLSWNRLPWGLHPSGVLGRSHQFTWHLRDDSDTIKQRRPNWNAPVIKRSPRIFPIIMWGVEIIVGPIYNANTMPCLVLGRVGRICELTLSSPSGKLDSSVEVVSSRLSDDLWLGLLL